LPEGVKTENATANFNNGVLEVTLDAPQTAKTASGSRFKAKTVAVSPAKVRLNWMTVAGRCKSLSATVCSMGLFVRAPSFLSAVVGKPLLKLAIEAKPRTLLD
jgi:hypothetical protein